MIFRYADFHMGVIFIVDQITNVIIEKMNIKEDSKVAEQTNDSMCVKCKSFFGNEAFGKMCSQCYKKHGAPSSQPKEEVLTPIKVANQIVEAKQQEKKEEKKEINKDRCSTCNRKLKLLGIQCRCGLFYCNSHRLPEDHSCTFNHKNAGKEKLIKQVIKVQNGKIESI